MKLRYMTHTNNVDPHGQRIQQFTDLNMCDDCIFRSEGLGDDLPDPDGIDTFDICPEWENWNFTFVFEDDDPEGEGDPVHGFSKSQCDVCHTTQYGDRHDVIATFIGQETT